PTVPQRAMSCRKLARAFNGGVAVLLLEFDSHNRCRLFADIGKRMGEAAGDPGDVAGMLMDFFALAVSIHTAQIEIGERDGQMRAGMPMFRTSETGWDFGATNFKIFSDKHLIRLGEYQQACDSGVGA